MKRVYVSGAYSAGDTVANVRAAIDAADKLLAGGHFPFLPHLTAFWHLCHPHPYEDWIRLDLEWLRVCDAVVRLPGESPGADREVALARELCIPVYEGVEAFLSRQEAGARLAYGQRPV